MKEDDFTETGRIIQLFTSIKGVSFEDAWRNKKSGKYEEENVYFIGLNELIKNKLTVNREQDKIDLKLLRKVYKK